MIIPINEDNVKVWGIHTREDNLFLKSDVIAIGWEEIGDLSKIDLTREAFKQQFEKAYSDAKKGAVATSAGMLYRFCHEVQVNDYIIFPSKNDRKINIGKVIGDYYYADQEGYPNRRNVKWLAHLPRTSFSQGALYEVGSALTFFAVKNYQDEFLAALDKGFKKEIASNTGPDETVGATADDIIETTKDFILKELSRQFKGYALEDFVANLLDAMGYRTTVSAHGGDSVIDIIAYKDELPPRIAVQVKSQDGEIKETTIQSLKGAMMPGDYGLFVTLSDYTKNARKYLDANPIIRGINGSELVDLILKYYELLDEKYQQLIPLKKVYIPVTNGDDNNG